MERYRWVKKYSSLGNVYYDVEDLMAITKSFLRLIIYIYPDEQTAKKGERGGASGFLVGVNHGGKNYLYAVSNAHVIEVLKRRGKKECIIRLNTLSDKIDTVSAPLDKWITHPSGDDVAVYLLEPSSHWRYNFITEVSFLRPEFIHGHISADEDEAFKYPVEKTPDHTKYYQVRKIGVGDETTTIGRYSLHSGTTQNLPVARFGHISMLPFEPVHQPDRNFDQDSFLVETHSINAFSGSPVFVNSSTMEKIDKADGQQQQSHYDTKTYLVGIDWGHFDFTGHLVDPVTNEVKTPSGMMCVVPAWKLSELLHTMELDMQRKELDKQLKKKQKQSGVSLDVELTKDEFEEALKKASRKTKPEKKPKSK